MGHSGHSGLRRAGCAGCGAQLTPINYQTLFGMQGRYLLPVLPLALLLLANNRTCILRRRVAHGAVLCVALFNLLTQLQGFGLYATWQPVS